MTQIVAHRGASGTRPENTLPSFAEAVRVDSDVIELDVHLSKDGHLIVMHDEDVERTTNGKGLIREKTLAEIKKLNAGSWFSSAYQNTKVPTLKEVLDLLVMRNFRGVLTIELKTDHYHYPEIEMKTATLMTSRAWPFTHWYCSFNIKSLDIIHKLEPQTQLDLILSTSNKKVIEALDHSYIEGIHPKMDWVLKNEASLADLPLAIRPWTIDEEALVKKCVALNTTGIITNFPEKAQQYIRNAKRSK